MQETLEEDGEMSKTNHTLYPTNAAAKNRKTFLMPCVWLVQQNKEENQLVDPIVMNDN